MDTRPPLTKRQVSAIIVVFTCVAVGVMAAQAIAAQRSGQNGTAYAIGGLVVFALGFVAGWLADKALEDDASP